MAQPVATVLLGGVDITLRVKAPRGAKPLSYGRGANFDGSTEAPGWCRIMVNNQDGAFNPRNAGSTYAGVLKLNKKLRVTAVHSATTYYLFDGYVRNITPLDDKWAVIYAEDALQRYGRLEANVVASTTRSLSGFRGAILDAVGEAGGNRALDAFGAEASVVYTGADAQPALDILTELNRATGAIHFIKPVATDYQYTVLDRTTLQSRASAETWSDADFANPFAEQLNWFDYSDERIVNEQRVQATPRLQEDDGVAVWERNWIRVEAGETRVRWPRFDDPTFQQTLSYTLVTGAPTVTFTPFARSSKISIAAGGSAAILKSLRITGRRALPAELDDGVALDLTSQGQYGIVRGSPITSEYLLSEAYAEALGNWYIYRYKDPRATPGPTFVNRFPTQLVREVGDRITYTSSEHSLSGLECLIRSFSTEVTNDGAEWRTTYVIEEVPAAVLLFTLGGTAGQGIGGTGILAY